MSNHLRRSQRVGPYEGGKDTNHVMIELRDSRQLHILHLNPRPRDARFQQEMSLYLQYRKSGPSVAGGPLTMPRRHPQEQQTSSQQLQSIQPGHSSTDSKLLPPGFTGSKGNSGSASPELHIDAHNSCNNSRLGESVVDNIPNYEGPSLSGTSSLMSSPSRTATIINNTRSASSVLVALHNQTLSAQKSRQLPAVHDSDECDLKLPLSAISGDAQETVNATGPLSPQTQTNDASTCPDLFTPRQENAPVTSDFDLPKTWSNLTSASASCDKDLVMFFIHGVGGSADIWRGQSEYFAKLGYEIVVPDLIGHGLSSAPKSKNAYHFKEIAADMEEIFDSFCKRRNVLIGHSYGASFATLLARTRSRRVTRLVLVSGGPPTPLAPQPGVFTLPRCMLSCIMPCLRKQFYRGAFHSKAEANGLSAPPDIAFHINTRVLQYTMNGQDWADGDELYHNWLTCPTLLLFGEKDGLVSYEEEQEMQKAIYDSRLVVIPEASHMVMMEASSQVNSLILSFVLHPSPPTHVQSPTHTDNKTTANHGNSVDNLQSAGRSKSSKSLRSVKTPKTPRPRPQRLLSKSIAL